MITKIAHAELTYKGRELIISTVQLSENEFETMAMYPNGHDIASRRTTTREAARAAHAEILAKYKTKPAAMTEIELGELIAERRADIEEFGRAEPVVVWIVKTPVGDIYTNYDFADEEMPITALECTEGEELGFSTLGEVLDNLNAQFGDGEEP